jgi:hypothetical protein
MNIDLLQERRIQNLATWMIVIGGVVGILVYLNQRKHNQVEKELFELDKEIKTLQLSKLKNGK